MARLLSLKLTILQDDAEELRQYDLKVHRAATKMEEAVAADLAILGIPFFGIKPELLSTIDNVPKSSTATSTADEVQQQPKQLSKSELVALKRKIIQHLEDMYKE